MLLPEASVAALPHDVRPLAGALRVVRQREQRRRLGVGARQQFRRDGVVRDGEEADIAQRVADPGGELGRAGVAQVDDRN